MKERLQETNRMRRLMGLPLITEQTATILSSMAPIIIKSQPLHIRNALRFLTLQKELSTNRDYTDDEINFIAATLCKKSKKHKSCDPKKWKGNDNMVITPDDYGLGYEKNKSYTQNIDNMDELARSISLGLGNSTIKDNGSTWLLTDVYNFDNAREFNHGGENRKKVYASLKNLPSDMLDNMKGIMGDDKTKYIERMMAWVHSTGYEGYKINLTIPKKNCEFCSAGDTNVYQDLKNAKHKAETIANKLKDSDGGWGDDKEAWVQSAFESITDKATYEKVKSILGEDPYEFVKDFMNTNKDYHNNGKTIDGEYKRIMS